MSTDNLTNPRGKKASPIETNPPEIPETIAKPVEDHAVEPDKDQVSELRQMFDKLFFATSAQSDRIHNEVLQIKSMQARQRDEVSDLKSSLIQMSAAYHIDQTILQRNLLSSSVRQKLYADTYAHHGNYSNFDARVRGGGTK
jgi:hypothetical protein